MAFQMLLFAILHLFSYRLFSYRILSRCRTLFRHHTCDHNLNRLGNLIPVIFRKLQFFSSVFTYLLLLNFPRRMGTFDRRSHFLVLFCHKWLNQLVAFKIQGDSVVPTNRHWSVRFLSKIALVKKYVSKVFVESSKLNNLRQNSIVFR